MNTWIYNKLLKDIIPYIRFSTYYPKLRGWKYRQGYAILKPGDFILTIDSKKLTTLLIGGEWAHAAYCRSKGDADDWEVSEMTHTDFTKSDFFDLCKEATRVAILRCDDFDQEYIERMNAEEKYLEDALYDRQFDLGSYALSCSEHVYKVDFERRLKVNLEDVLGVGVKSYISPTGLWNTRDTNAKVVWDSDEAKKLPYMD